MEPKPKGWQWWKRKFAIRAATCIASGSKVLYTRAGFATKVDDTSYPWFPGTALQKLAQGRLYGADGEVLIPKIYVLNRNYNEFWNTLPTWRKVAGFIIPVMLNPATWGKKTFDP